MLYLFVLASIVEQTAWKEQSCRRMSRKLMAASKSSYKDSNRAYLHNQVSASITHLVLMDTPANTSPFQIVHTFVIDLIIL